jgi:outer membrane protein, heavy metal efflux system
MLTWSVVGCSGIAIRPAALTEPPVEPGRPGEQPMRGASRVAPNASTTTLPADADLDTCVRFAMAHSPVLDAAYQRWRAALERVPQATALPDPRLGFGIVLDQVDENAERMGERYSISQMFPWFGKLALRGDMATEAARVEALRFEAARLQLVERVTRAWYEYAFLIQAADIARENRDLLSRLEAVARSRYRAGAAPLADVNRAQLELGRLDDRVRSLQDMLLPVAAELNIALGRPALAPLPRPSAPSGQSLPALPQRDDRAWLAVARERNPDLQASRHQFAREERSVELARKEYYPDITLGLEYARDGAARMARMDGGGADMLVGVVSISVPLRRGRIAAGVREAEARLDGAMRELQARELDLEAAVSNALFNYRDSGRRLNLYGSTLLPTARQAMSTTEAAYRAGAAGFSDLVDAQRVLLEFELARERAAADRAGAVARIHALLGPEAGAIGSDGQRLVPHGELTR